MTYDPQMHVSLSDCDFVSADETVEVRRVCGCSFIAQSFRLVSKSQQSPKPLTYMPAAAAACNHTQHTIRILLSDAIYLGRVEG